ncbi:MAG TPA: amidohydrolase [Longimicrobiales bacterium]
MTREAVPSSGTLVLADRVHTFADPAVVDALLLRDGRIVAIGAADALRRRAPDAALLDLRGTTITPGLCDAHIHLVDWALARRAVDLADAPDADAAAEAVARRARSLPAGAWLHGGGWSVNRWGAFPDRRPLDRAAPGHPVLLRSHDLHSAWVNGRALEIAGISAATPDPDGGRILRDDAGEPTGVLLENAVRLVERVVPPTPDAEIEDAVLDAQRELHALGITAVHSFPSVHPGRLDALRVLERLRAAGRLRLRVLQQLPLEFLDDAIRLGLRSGFGGDWIRIGGVKMFLDGALGSRTAWLREPYVDSDDRGVQLLPAADFRDAVRRAAEAGLAATVHAIGDAAVALALDVLGDAAVRVDAMPHRIEHVQLCPPERFGDLGRADIVGSVQPCHLMTDWQAAERYWGADRCRGAYAFRSLEDAGAVLAFGSDAPVERVDPRLGLFAATTRRDLDDRPRGGWLPGERISILDAFRGYTTGPAHAAGALGRLGRLAPGAAADFVAWDADPLRTAGRALLSLRCIAAVVDGERVWHAEAATRRDP